MRKSPGAPRTAPESGLSARETEASRRFVLAFSQLLRVSRFHELGNAALLESLESVCRMTRELCEGGRRTQFFINEEQIFVNRKWVRFPAGSFRRILEFVRHFEEKGLAGFEVLRPWSRGELRNFLEIFHGVTSDVADAADHIRAEIERSGLTVIRVIKSGRAVRFDRDALRMDESQVAPLLYAKLVVILRMSLRHWEDEDRRSLLGSRGRRVLQHIITRAEKDPRPFLWLSNVKEEDEYLYTHSANVALLSLLIGLELGIERGKVCDLALAALFHDLGRIRLPAKVLRSTEKFTDRERGLMARHPIHGMNLLLGLKKLNEPLLQRLVVVFEHNIESNGYPRKSWPRGLHLFSRIVAVADAYDAMTTRRSFRPAKTPAEALRELFEAAGRRYDADVVKVLANVLGIYPLGMLVLLDTGEAGLVYHVDPAAPRRPLVKLVRDTDGGPLRDGDVVDLAAVGPEGRPLRTIVGTDDPARHGIHVPSHIGEKVE
jgi:HD-GYP domain-containing protein (c-di-GMP phosphodiesterase class II)